MEGKSDQVNMDPLDTTETDKWVGKPLGGGQLKEPISLNDIRRCVPVDLFSRGCSQANGCTRT
jgi:hypothetical protein